MWIEFKSCMRRDAIVDTGEGRSPDPVGPESRTIVQPGSLTGLDCPPPGHLRALNQDQPDQWKLGLHAPCPKTFLPEHCTHFNADSTADGVNAEANGWHIPDAVAYELVGLFFDYIQNWLPVLHRPLFYRKYVGSEDFRGRVVSRQTVCNDDAILINGVFALAARFSKASFFSDTDPVLRGKVFAERAAALKDLVLKGIEEPSLELVKGCVLLAFYNITAGHAAPGSLLVSVCVRFAYDLGLNETDDEDKIISDAEEDPDVWIRKEELRRLWWVIYELDCFVSTVSCQPYGIERGEIKVLLPVADHQWFNGLSIKSSYLIERPGAIWKSLAGSENQSPRAWYLVANYLKSYFADDARQPKRNTSDMQAALEMDLACFKHALPAGFQLRVMNVNENNFGNANWVISTHCMVLSCEALLERRRWCHAGPEPSLNIVQEAATFGRHFYSSLVRIAQIWPPEYIPLNHPFMSCCMINPWDALAAQHEPNFQSYELSKLLLSHYSRYWRIGGALLRLLSIIHEGRDSAIYQPGSHEREVIKRFSVLCPSSSKKRNSAALNPSAQTTYDPSDPPAETLPGSDFTNPEDSDELNWALNLWDNLQAFDADQPEMALFSIPSGNHVEAGSNGPIDSGPGAQLRTSVFPFSPDGFPDEFATL
ncbi:Fungal specific transcription factor domain-containing protein [Cladophialophora immunda]|nr:Fungal specific transcription factor domain-containing protein [Cladophialophora immunda]